MEQLQTQSAPCPYYTLDMESKFFGACKTCGFSKHEHSNIQTTPTSNKVNALKMQFNSGGSSPNSRLGSPMGLLTSPSGGLARHEFGTPYSEASASPSNKENFDEVNESPIDPLKKSQAKFRGTWTPEISNPTPQSFLPKQQSFSSINSNSPKRLSFVEKFASVENTTPEKELAVNESQCAENDADVVDELVEQMNVCGEEERVTEGVLEVEAEEETKESDLSIVAEDPVETVVETGEVIEKVVPNGVAEETVEAIVETEEVVKEDVSNGAAEETVETVVEKEEIVKEDVSTGATEETVETVVEKEEVVKEDVSTGATEETVEAIVETEEIVKEDVSNGATEETVEAIMETEEVVKEDVSNGAAEEIVETVVKTEGIIETELSNEAAEEIAETVVKTEGIIETELSNEAAEEIVETVVKTEGIIETESSNNEIVAETEHEAIVDQDSIELTTNENSVPEFDTPIGEMQQMQDDDPLKRAYDLQQKLKAATPATSKDYKTQDDIMSSSPIIEAVTPPQPLSNIVTTSTNQNTTSFEDSKPVPRYMRATVSSRNKQRIRRNV